ncbi:uncharacterized protein LOC134228603 [Saccostrea cucullata]|uniref:uncharacterized protein LOC134228603 n=1 Tax=Saccostrea cuccullata TaxID=36930 RepID=UPI002ED0F04C
METFVESCPRNITEVLESSTRLGCGQDIYGNNQYICVPHTNKTGLVQLCFRGVMKLIERGNCLETDGENLYRVDCLGFSSGCPDEDYQSNTIYQYPACQSINTEKQCFLAESSCLYISWSTVTSNTSFDIQITTPAPQYDPSYAAEIAGGLTAGLFILAVILIFAVVLWRKRQNQNIEEQEDTPCILFKRKSIKCDEEIRQGLHF